MNPAVLVVFVVLGYLAVGGLIALPVMVLGAGRIDPVARGASLAVRLLLVPGAASLWPVMLWRFVRGAPRPEAASSDETPNLESAA